MVELVKIHNTIKLGSEVVNTVNARDLHKALEVGRDFSNWIKKRLAETQAEEGVDFIKLDTSDARSPNLALEGLELFDTNNSKINNLNKRVEYFITIDLAKEISMLERNEIGKKVRKYFIECEKQLKSIKANPLDSILDISDPGSLFKALEKTIEAGKVLYAENKVLTIENKELKETINEQKDDLQSYKYSHEEYKRRKDKWALFVKQVKKYAFHMNMAVPDVYRKVYASFAESHNFSYDTKVNKDLIYSNTEYINEVLSIITSMIIDYRENSSVVHMISKDDIEFDMWN